MPGFEDRYAVRQRYSLTALSFTSSLRGRHNRVAPDPALADPTLTPDGSDERVIH